MSGPTNPLHGGGWRSFDQPPPPKPTRPKTGKRKFTVRISPPRERREQAMEKWMTTTEALTPVEKAAVQRYRARIDIEKEND
jgi:hypothetical protein